MNIQELASAYQSCFEKITRDNGETVWIISDIFDKCDNLTNMIRSAHGDMLPDDWRYEFIVEALSDLADCNDPDEVYPEPDIWNHDLLKWVGSHLDRVWYVDEAVQEYGIDARDFSLISTLQMGQTREKEEVLEVVRSHLQEQLEEMETAREDLGLDADMSENGD